MNEKKPSIDCVFLHSHYRYYVPSPTPPIRNTISPSLYAFFFTFRDGRVSSSEPHFSYIPFPIYRGIPPCCFPVSFTRSMAFTHTPKVQLPFALFSETFLTIRQNSLYVTVCIIARPSYRGYFIHSLSTLHYCNAPSLATRLTGDYRDRTYTG